ncbi:MAG: hypothetical protein ACREYF_22785, partial [Gammaproteobacteria bacterium]
RRRSRAAARVSRLRRLKDPYPSAASECASTVCWAWTGANDASAIGQRALGRQRVLQHAVRHGVDVDLSELRTSWQLAGHRGTSDV